MQGPQLLSLTVRTTSVWTEARRRVVRWRTSPWGSGRRGRRGCCCWPCRGRAGRGCSTSVCSRAEWGSDSSSDTRQHIQTSVAMRVSLLSNNYLESPVDCVSKHKSLLYIYYYYWSKMFMYCWTRTRNSAWASRSMTTCGTPSHSSAGSVPALHSCNVPVLYCCRGILFESFVDDDEPRKGEETVWVKVECELEYQFTLQFCINCWAVSHTLLPTTASHWQALAVFICPYQYWTKYLIHRFRLASYLQMKT